MPDEVFEWSVRVLATSDIANLLLARHFATLGVEADTTIHAQAPRQSISLSGAVPVHTLWVCTDRATLRRALDTLPESLRLSGVRATCLGPVEFA